jgi:hypothetical protein
MVQRKVAANGFGIVDAGASQPAGEPDDQDNESYSGDREDQVQRAHDSGTSSKRRMPKSVNRRGQ